MAIPAATITHSNWAPEWTEPSPRNTHVRRVSVKALRRILEPWQARPTQLNLQEAQIGRQRGAGSGYEAFS